QLPVAQLAQGGTWVVDIAPLPQPLQCEIPFPAWLISDEGLAVVEAWRAGELG
ncbi:MAG: hypothetical protein HC914_21155, partial [Chloroflexaceae bacterium]|nr:hypothetical protein [Chloroflexaceae bacterium]